MNLVHGTQSGFISYKDETYTLFNAHSNVACTTAKFIGEYQPQCLLTLSRTFCQPQKNALEKVWKLENEMWWTELWYFLWMSHLFTAFWILRRGNPVVTVDNVDNVLPLQRLLDEQHRVHIGAQLLFLLEYTFSTNVVVSTCMLQVSS